MNSFDDVAFVDTARNIALNDLGQIAIAAHLTNGQQTIFVLTPIPEPSTYALMLVGLGVLGAMGSRRQRDCARPPATEVVVPARTKKTKKNP